MKNIELSDLEVIFMTNCAYAKADEHMNLAIDYKTSGDNDKYNFHLELSLKFMKTYDKLKAQW